MIQGKEVKEKKEERKFILVTCDFTGMGWAKWASDKDKNLIVGLKFEEGDEPEDSEEEDKMYNNGMFEVEDLDYLMDNREDYRDYYWIWDANHHPEENELLREEGFKVFGSSQYQNDSENDREFGIKEAESVGLKSPEWHEFKNYKEGIKFLEQNEDRAFVFKPNSEEDKSLTFCSQTVEPANANQELREYIDALQINDFILQERVKGVEVNVEVMFVNGEPKFALADLENKKLMAGEQGIATGCIFDVVWVIDLNCGLVKNTVGKFFQMVREMRYTGLWDANVIVSDDDFYFLEYCKRWGYNQHPNFFSTLCKQDMFDFVADALDGKLKTDFKAGFGASVSLRVEKPRKRVPIYFPDSLAPYVYLYDVYKEDGKIKFGGGSPDVGFVSAHNYTIETAFQDAMEDAKKVIMSDIAYRIDPDKTTYHNNPIRRFEALQSLKLI